jgi:hypothetical protein
LFCPGSILRSFNFLFNNFELTALLISSNILDASCDPRDGIYISGAAAEVAENPSAKPLFDFIKTESDISLYY